MNDSNEQPRKIRIPYPGTLHVYKNGGQQLEDYDGTIEYWIDNVQVSEAEWDARMGSDAQGEPQGSKS